MNWVYKWVQLHNGEWCKASVVPLNAALPEWGKEPFVADCPVELAAKEKQETVRVVCPQEFLSAPDWQLVQSKPGRLLEEILPEGMWTRSFGWHAETREAAVIGFLKVPPSQTAEVLALSGERGVFFALGRPKAGTPAQSVRWLPRDDKVKPGTYLQTAKKHAEAASTSLTFRRGGRASLGLVGVAVPETAAEGLRKRWAARQVPKHWTPAQFQRMLELHQWRVPKDIQPPARPGGVWTFAAVRPESCKEDCFILALEEGRPLTIAPWKKTVPKPESTPLWASGTGGALQGKRPPSEARATEEEKGTAEDPDAGPARSTCPGLW